MAVAGDILVKLALDFAGFSDGMEKANAKLDEQGKKLSQHGNVLKDIGQQLAGLAQSGSVDQFTSRPDALAGTLGKLGGILLAVDLAIRAVTASITQARQIEDYALAVQKLSDQYKISNEQAAALQSASQRLGITVDDLKKRYDTVPGSLEALGKAHAEAFGKQEQVVKDIAAASQRLSDTWDNLKEKTVT